MSHWIRTKTKVNQELAHGKTTNIVGDKEKMKIETKEQKKDRNKCF